MPSPYKHLLPPPEIRRALDHQPGMADVVKDAFQRMGGRAAFSRWAKANPDVFYTKVVPKLIPAQVTGADGGPLQVVVSPPAPLTERVPGVLNSPIQGVAGRRPEGEE